MSYVPQRPIRGPFLHGQVNFPLTLAPMVGLSHVALRQVLREYLPQNASTLWPTEMLNSRRLPDEDFTKVPETLRESTETNLIPQILGNERKAIEVSIRRLVDEWGASGIDINMGCPVQKALKHNYGVALMGDPAYAAEVVRMAAEASTVPVSVKLRAVESQGDVELLANFVQGLVQAGAQWICLHPRTAAQKRRGRADWSQILSLRSHVSVPIVGNGDIQTSEDVFQMLNETQCDLVMSGRGLAARPWMLWQVGEDLGFAPPTGREGQKAPRTGYEEGAEYGRSLLRLIAYSDRYFGDSLGLRKVRFYLRTTSVWLMFGQELMAISTRVKNLEELAREVEKFFSSPMEMLQKTELRQ